MLLYALDEGRPGCLRELAGQTVVGEQAGGRHPVAGGLGVLDGLHLPLVSGEPVRGMAMQPDDLNWRGAAQLHLQQVR